MIYRFRDGSRFSGNAELAAAELERIRTEQGTLKAETIVTEATPEDAALHGWFEWNDAAAAHEHRLDQARRLVRAIVIVHDNLPPTSMYVHVREQEAREGGYEPLTIVASHPDRYLMALSEAEVGLSSARRRVDELLDAAKSGGAKKGEVARIMLAIQALQTANEAIQSLH